MEQIPPVENGLNAFARATTFLIWGRVIRFPFRVRTKFFIRGYGSLKQGVHGYPYIEVD